MVLDAQGFEVVQRPEKGQVPSMGLGMVHYLPFSRAAFSKAHDAQGVVVQPRLSHSLPLGGTGHAASHALGLRRTLALGGDPIASATALGASEGHGSI